MILQPAIFDAALFAVLRVQETDVAQVRRVTLPRWPWKHARASAEREALLRRITDKLPFRALWLSDWSSEAGAAWRILSPTEALDPADESVGLGAWALLFFDREPVGIERRPEPVYPQAPIEALRALDAHGAAAAIWSWYDDIEWLVAVREPR